MRQVGIGSILVFKAVLLNVTPLPLWHYVSHSPWRCHHPHPTQQKYFSHPAQIAIHSLGKIRREGQAADRCLFIGRDEQASNPRSSSLR